MKGSSVTTKLKLVFLEISETSRSHIHGNHELDRRKSYVQSCLPAACRARSVHLICHLNHPKRCRKEAGRLVRLCGDTADSIWKTSVGFVWRAASHSVLGRRDERYVQILLNVLSAGVRRTSKTSLPVQSGEERLKQTHKPAEGCERKDIKGLSTSH